VSVPRHLVGLFTTYIQITIREWRKWKQCKFIEADKWSNRKEKFSHLLMMGDFNLPNIDWESWNNKSDNIERQDYKSIQCIQDNFLYQHVNKPTRWRGTDTPHVLDLVFTNEENMIATIGSDYRTVGLKSCRTITTHPRNSFPFILAISLLKCKWGKYD
jgi:hypothetical protein